MTDIVNKKFKWKSIEVVQDNLDKKYQNVQVADLHDYIQCGHSYAYIPDSLDNYFKLMFGNRPQPPVQSNCICGAYIKMQCYVCPKNAPYYENIIVVGNECIDKFSDRIDSIRGRRCEVCFTRHHNRSFNLCKEHIQVKNRISKTFYQLVNNMKFHKTFIQKYIEKHRLIQNQNVSYLKKGFSGFKHVLQVIHVLKNMMSKHYCKTRHYFENTPRVVYATKLIVNKKLWNSKMLQLIFRQFKVHWILKYCTLKEQLIDLNPKLRTYLLSVIDNRKNLMPCGKYKGRTFNYFYNNSTSYHKQYFMDIQNPGIKLTPLLEYIHHLSRLSDAGYCLNIPDTIQTILEKSTFDTTEDIPFVSKEIPELKLLDDSELFKIKQEDKNKYEMSIKCKNNVNSK